MRYMLLIYSEPSEMGDPAEMSPEETEAMMAPWATYTQQMRDAGAFLAGDPLEGIETATTVRRRDGEVSTTDGPFAETKEVLGGYYLVDVDSLDEALDWAARCPGAEYGSVEVRPVPDLPELA